MTRLQRFFSAYESPNTVEVYKWGLTAFFKVLYGPGDLEAQAEAYFKTPRNYEQDLRTFFAAMKQHTAKTALNYLGAVRSFLLENDVELPEIFWRRMRRRKKGRRALTLDKVPTHQELRKILSHMPLQGRAFYLMQASSGMRPDEPLHLLLEEVDLTRDPARITLSGIHTKTGDSRYVFITSEAKEALQEWLKIRSAYLRSSLNRGPNSKEPRDPRLFPFKYNTVWTIWQNAIKKAGFTERDPHTNRFKLHPHVLRKFFRTHMATLIQKDLVEALMGHEEYLDEVYRRYSLEQLEEFYRKGEPSLLVYSDGQKVSKLQGELQERERQLQTVIDQLAIEVLQLRSRVERLEQAQSKPLPIA